MGKFLYGGEQFEEQIGHKGEGEDNIIGGIG